MIIQESAENYLEAILILKQKQGSVRSVDIAHHLAFSKPSVSRAMGLLKNGGYIKVDENGYITLLEPGREVAEMIYERHTLLAKFLVHLGVSPDTAAEDACKLEHVISNESFQAIKRHAHLGMDTE